MNIAKTEALPSVINNIIIQNPGKIEVNTFAPYPDMIKKQKSKKVIIKNL